MDAHRPRGRVRPAPRGLTWPAVTPRAPRSREIREQLDHPIIDNDGHIIEFLPLVRDVLVELAGESVAEQFDVVVASGRLTQSMSAEERRAAGMARMPWWGLPTRNTLDRATAMLPALLYDRLDEIGIDFAFALPDVRAHRDPRSTDDELRQALSRAFNTYYAEVYAPYDDRLLPVAVHPDVHARGGGRRARPRGRRTRTARRHDGRRSSAADTGPATARLPLVRRSRATTSAYDYAPVWERCVELGVSPTFHSTGGAAAARTSPTNYVFNHIGNFAAAGEAVRALAALRRRARPLPAAALRVPRGRRGLGGNLYADVARPLGEAQPSTPSARTTRPRSTARCSRRCSRRTPSAGSRDRLDRLDDGLHMLSEPFDERLTPLDEFAESGS